MRYRRGGQRPNSSNFSEEVELGIVWILVLRQQPGSEGDAKHWNWSRARLQRRARSRGSSPVYRDMNSDSHRHRPDRQWHRDQSSASNIKLRLSPSFPAMTAERSSIWHRFTLRAADTFTQGAGDESFVGTCGLQRLVSSAYACAQRRDRG